MEIVIGPIGADGGCGAMIVEPIDCDGTDLLVRRNTTSLRIPLSSIVDWSPIGDDEIHFALDSWIKRGPDVIYF